MFADPACIHAMTAVSSYQLALLKTTDPRQLHRQADDGASELLNHGSAHVIQAARLLNKKFESPADALSTTSIICAAILGSCTVSTIIIIIVGLWPTADSCHCDRVCTIARTPFKRSWQR